MARNGSGIYILPPSNPVVSGTVIESDWANDTMADLAAALSQSIAYDGQTVPINNLPMGGFHHTNVSDPTSRNQYASLGMVQDGRHQRVQINSGVDNLVGTLVGGATAYVAGALVSFFAPSTNTGPMTLNYNGIGARSLISSAGLPLAAGQVTAGSFLMAIYDGTQFKLISAVTATVDVGVLTLATTGQERPGGGAYTPLTIATGTSINVPSGVAWIIPPDSDDPNDAVKVTWPDQAITLTFLATSFTTTIAVNNFGQIVQFAGRVIGANLRSCAVLGVVEHITGVANRVVTKPTIFADDGYRNTDVTSLLANTVISGGKVVPNGVSLLQLDISAGAIFMAGGDANSINSPNVFAIPQQSNIQFKTLAGQNTVGATISNAPITNYDPNGAGVVTVIPGNNDTVVHRLYFLYGSYIWVYGQRIFNDVENAMSLLEWDRSQYKPSLFLMDATLVAEIIAIKNTTNLGTVTQCRIVSPGGLNFSIGSPGGISEAPINGTPYGRQDAAWVSVLRQTAPSVLNSLSVTGSPNPFISIFQNPVAAGSITTAHNRGVQNWFTIQTVWPDDKTYFRSWNPADSSLRFTTTYDLATGVWDFPANPTFGGNGLVAGPGVAVDNDVARFSGTTGKLLKAGLKYQTSQTDTTAGALLVQSAFGLGRGIVLANSINLNTDPLVGNAGFFRLQSTPFPAPANMDVQFSPMLVVRGADTIAQYATAYTTGRTAVRAGSPPLVGGAGAFSPWQIVISQTENYEPASADLNGYKTPGAYMLQPGTINVPENSFYILEVYCLDSNNVMQRITSNTSPPKIWIRNLSGGVWGFWYPHRVDFGFQAPTPNADYFDGGSLRCRRLNNTCYLTGLIGRNTVMSPSDVIMTVPANQIPWSPVYWSGLVSYNNLGSQIAGCTLNLVGQVQLGFVITIGGSPAGVCNMGFDQSWLSNI